MGRPHDVFRLAVGRRPVCHYHQRTKTALSWPHRRRTMHVLGIETSADDTCAALLEIQGRGANKVAYTLHEDRISCANAHKGGIHPVEAVVSHTKHLSPMIQNLMQKWAASSPAVQPKPDLIAVTRGPGMGGCLSVGVTTAQGLAVAWGIPIIGVHHMQAHALTPMMEAALARGAAANQTKQQQQPQQQQQETPPPPPPITTTTTTPNKDDDNDGGPTFPFLTLLISGKHTLLVHTQSPTTHRILAKANTIALGDMLDKCAREILPADLIPTAPGASVVYPQLMEAFVADEPLVRNYSSHYHHSDTKAKKAREPDVERDVPPVYVSARYGWELSPPTRISGRDSLQFDFTGFGGAVRKIVQQRRDAAAATAAPPPLLAKTQSTSSPTTPNEEQEERDNQEPILSLPERRTLALQTMKLAFEHVLRKVLLALRTDPSLVATPPSHLVLSGGVASNRFLRTIAETVLHPRNIKVVAPQVRHCTDNAPMIAWAGAQMYEEEGWRTELGFAPQGQWSMEQIVDGEVVDCWVRRSDVVA